MSEHGVGFFHFVEGFEDPIGSLCRSLSDQPNARGSLIVLPEAFNKGSHYCESRPPAISAQATNEKLAEIATELDLVFITGLLSPPRSSAYLVSRSGAHLLCHKKTQDGTGNYDACATQCDPRNPFRFGNLVIAAIICVDVQLPLSELFSRADAMRAGARTIACIPAFMSHHFFDGDVLSSIDWKGKYVILANSRPDGCGSFIATTSGKKAVNYRAPSNAVHLRTFDELDT